MRWVTAGLGLAWLVDAGLRLFAHGRPGAGLDQEVLPALHLASVPAGGTGLSGLGPLASASVVLSLALLAAGAFVLTQALLDLPRGRLFHLGLLAAAGLVAWAGLDVAECLAFGRPMDSLAWEGPSTWSFDLGDAALPLCLVALAGAWTGQLIQGGQQPP